MPLPTLNYLSCADGAGGHRMAFWQWGGLDAASVIVCVHGLARQGRDFDVLAQALLARSLHPLRIICPDVVGRGRSDWLKDPMGYGVPRYAADILALLGFLHAQAPMGRLDWVGTSMGGLIGMAVAGTPGLSLPSPIRRLVLNDVGPVIEWAALQRIGTYLGKGGVFASQQEGADALRAFSASFGPHTSAQWDELSSPMLRQLPKSGWALHYDPAIALPFAQLTEEAARQGQSALWALYDGISTATLLTRGAQSDLLSRSTAIAMTGRGPRAQLVEFEGVGHAPTFVADLQVDTVSAFLLSD